jgi:putative restriction endonuclease
LIARVEAALAAGGWGVIWTPPLGGNPRSLRIFRSPESFDVKLYIWTLTHGGKGRAADEWRIQPTGIASFAPAATGKTVILGYDPARNLFVGFDVAFHKGPLGASPSMQTKESALEDALKTGFGPYRKGNNEVAVAVQPEHLGTYISGLEALHASGASAPEAKLIEQMGQNPESVTPEDVDSAAAPARRWALQTTLRALRDSRFRSRVLKAYGNRCAACDLQLGLLDGAHILPVGHPESTDAVPNGVALCALHHRAYDASLITFDKVSTLHISGDAEARLVAQGLDGGLPGFKKSLRPKISLPIALAERPSVTMIEKANALRGWPL